MDVIVDSVAPGIAPAVACKEIIEQGRRIKPSGKTQRAAINDEGHLGWLGNDPVVPQTEGVGFSFANQSGGVT